MNDAPLFIWKDRDMGELYHYGVKGMKWGVRKSPNRKYFGSKDPYEKYKNGPDGETTLLSNDKQPKVKTSKYTKQERRDRLNSARNTAYETRNISYNARETTRSLSRLKKMRTSPNKTPNLSSMSDEELKKAVNRMNLEKQYNSLNAKETKNGYDYATEVLTTVGSVVGIVGGVLTIYSTIDTLKSK